MSEINGKKYYTWQDIVAMPLRTKFRLHWWDKGTYMYFSRNSTGLKRPYLNHHMPESADYNFMYLLFMQDRFELYEEPKSERAISFMKNINYKELGNHD